MKFTRTMALVIASAFSMTAAAQAQGMKTMDGAPAMAAPTTTAAPSAGMGASEPMGKTMDHKMAPMQKTMSGRSAWHHHHMMKRHHMMHRRMMHHHHM